MFRSRPFIGGNVQRSFTDGFVPPKLALSESFDSFFGRAANLRHAMLPHSESRTTNQNPRVIEQSPLEVNAPKNCFFLDPNLAKWDTHQVSWDSCLGRIGLSLLCTVAQLRSPAASQPVLRCRPLVPQMKWDGSPRYCLICELFCSAGPQFTFCAQLIPN